MPGRSANLCCTRTTFTTTRILVRIHDHKVLLDAVFGRDQTCPLITVSNHQSMIDDPALCLHGMVEIAPENV